MINWKEVCEQNMIEFREGGASSKRNNIYISCPYCPDDHKMLMGLDLETGAWGCWKENEHRGSDPLKLLMKLLHISRDDARTMLGISTPHPTAQSILDMLHGMKQEFSPSKITVEKFVFRNDFKLVQPGTRPFARVDTYLAERGFRHRAAMIEKYALRYHPQLGSEGARTRRVVLPVHATTGTLIGYTARALNDCEIRYFSWPRAIKDHLFNAKACARGGKVLVIVEGPFDALKLDWVARWYNLPVRVVGIMGLALTDARVAELAVLVRKFKRAVLLMDRSALKQAIKMQRQLPFDVAVAQLDRKYKDPGAVPWRPARQLLESFL